MSGRNIIKFSLAYLGLLIIAGPTLAHHNAFAHFDRNDPVEILGVLTEVGWHNPHVQLKVLAPDEDGIEVIWQIEEAAVNEQIRRGATLERYRIGEEIRVAGLRGRRNKNAIFATNTLLVADGIELVAPGRKPRWSENLLMSRQEYQASKTEASSATAMGLFRVWSRYLTPGGRQLWNDSYPLTEQAAATRENWDSVADNPYIYCQNAMPAIMDTGGPFEFVRDGEDVLIRFEEQDLTRRVHMAANPSTSAPNPYGHSVGRWEGETLVISTTEIDFAWFDQEGTPQSEALETEERFSVSDDNRFLNLEMTATDPAVFTEPVVLTRQWVWVPDVEIEAFNCTYERYDL
jgi:hypothetical protein